VKRDTIEQTVTLFVLGFVRLSNIDEVAPCFYLTIFKLKSGLANPDEA